MNKYILLNDRIIGDQVFANSGIIVYDCVHPDYGVANDDTRYFGYDHISVTVNPDGSYPFFTVPVKDLERIDNVQ